MTFWFRVPLVLARGGTTAAPDVETEARRQARRERRILVVDDRSANRSVALALLRKLGYAAEAVEGGEEALAFLAGSPCAAVQGRIGEASRLLGLSPKAVQARLKGFLAGGEE